MLGVTLTDLKQIYHPKGDIYHIIKKSDATFNGFGEAYFSAVKTGEIKGWKKHSKMTLNLVVPVGEVKFVIYDGEHGSFFSVNLSHNNYKRLTIKPNLWVAFQGIGESNLVLNVADLEHNPQEAINMDLDRVDYEW